MASKDGQDSKPEQDLLLHLENAAQSFSQRQLQKLLNQFLSKFKVSMKSHIFTLITKFCVQLKTLNLSLTGWIKQTSNGMQNLSLLLILIHSTVNYHKKTCQRSFFIVPLCQNLYKSLGQHYYLKICSKKSIGLNDESRWFQTYAFKTD